jgi:hypothetical protein
MNFNSQDIETAPCYMDVATLLFKASAVITSGPTPDGSSLGDAWAEIEKYGLEKNTRSHLITAIVLSGLCLLRSPGPPYLLARSCLRLYLDHR